ASDGRQIKRLPGHEGLPITGLMFSPSGTTLVSVARDSTLRVWDVNADRLLRVLKGHEHSVNAIVVSDDGEMLASAGEGGHVVLWDAQGKILYVLEGHRAAVRSLALSHRSQRLASASDDGRILIWDVATGQLLQTLLGHAGPVNDISFARNGEVLFSAGDDGTVRRWNTVTGVQQKLLKRAPMAMRATMLSSNGVMLASGNDSNEILLLSPDTGTEQRRLIRHAAPVTDLAFSPDTRTLASVGEDNLLVLWDTRTGAVRWAANMPVSRPSAQQGAATMAEHASEALIGMMAAPAAAAPTVALADGPGGPILIVYSAANPFGRYYAEILRAEGLNLFASVELGTLNAPTLAGYDVVLLAETSLSTDQVTLFSDWVSAGGNLIAMRPDKQLAGILGLSNTSGTFSDVYLKVDTTAAPGNGIVDESIQFHGTADRYRLNGATAVATLYSDAGTATANPAVTLRSVGASGGQAAAFTYDLARSVVYQRQGNPSWVGQERDTFAPIRSDDLFFGNLSGDTQPDWIDLSKVDIPQADEQQRLLVNLILSMNTDRKPLPRFWYFPSGHRAVVIMTGDDHSNNGSAPRFDQLIASSPAGCSVDDWQCIRATSYLYTDTPLTDANAASYANAGFEIALHVNTDCNNFTPESLRADFSSQLSSWRAKYTSLSSPTTERTHCLVWSDWDTQPQVELENGMRLDTNYYYWPPSWIQDRPGYFTGSGMPMRFAALDGAMYDIYQATTQNTDESGQS
ncbi:MAG: WD40 repeat domain-containing protein, partial [Oscillochloris sp.]|nr:WD40 repeat domain-containing protein [Oscillochloris sp.]